MKKLLFPALLLIAACSPAAVQPTPHPTAVSEAAARPAWHTMPLTNARTGETFTFADFEGKIVYVEPMATWCINCMNQQRALSS